MSVSAVLQDWDQALVMLVYKKYSYKFATAHNMSEKLHLYCVFINIMRKKLQTVNLFSYSSCCSHQHFIMISEGFLVKYWAVSSRQDMFTLLIFNKNPDCCWTVKVWQAHSLKSFPVSVRNDFKNLAILKPNWGIVSVRNPTSGWQRPCSSSSSSSKFPFAFNVNVSDEHASHSGGKAAVAQSEHVPPPPPASPQSTNGTDIVFILQPTANSSAGIHDCVGRAIPPSTCNLTTRSDAVCIDII